MKTDEQLIRDIASGDENAFTQIVTRYQKKVLNLCYRFSRDPYAAEDATQEVFLKVWKSAGRFLNQSMFSTWLYRIAVNTCLNQKITPRQKPSANEWSGEPQNVELTVETMLTPSQILEKEERELRVQDAISRLPGNQRTAIILSRFEGHSYDEISAIMNVSRSAVESLLFRAKQNLLKYLQPLKEKNEI